MQLDVQTALLLQRISWQFFPTGPWFPLVSSGGSLGKEEGGGKQRTLSHLFSFLSKLIAFVFTK